MHSTTVKVACRVFLSVCPHEVMQRPLDRNLWHFT